MKKTIGKFAPLIVLAMLVVREPWSSFSWTRGHATDDAFLLADIANVASRCYRQDCCAENP